MKKGYALLLALLLVLGLFRIILPSAQAARVQEAEQTAENADTSEAPLQSQRLENALAWALAIAEDDSHGYSRYARFGPNYDCSSFVCTALMEGGFELESCVSTYYMKSTLEEIGFTAYRKGEVTPQRGDILINSVRHVEFCMGGTDCLAAHMDYDYRSGDSTGKEIQYRTDGDCSFCKYCQYTWILRYEGKDPVEFTQQVTSEAVTE